MYRCHRCARRRPIKKGRCPARRQSNRSDDLIKGASNNLGPFRSIFSPDYPTHRYVPHYTTTRCIYQKRRRPGNQATRQPGNRKKRGNEIDRNVRRHGDNMTRSSPSVATCKAFPPSIFSMSFLCGDRKHTVARIRMTWPQTTKSMIENKSYCCCCFFLNDFD